MVERISLSSSVRADSDLGGLASGLGKDFQLSHGLVQLEPENRVGKN
jgi:hypothetical protein